MGLASERVCLLRKMAFLGNMDMGRLVGVGGFCWDGRGEERGGEGRGGEESLEILDSVIIKLWVKREDQVSRKRERKKERKKAKKIARKIAIKTQRREQIISY